MAKIGEPTPALVDGGEGEALVPTCGAERESALPLVYISGWLRHAMHATAERPAGLLGAETTPPYFDFAGPNGTVWRNRA